uniref:Poly (ADP-ribose) polymerase family, member 12a n=1 Tax=Oryzias latipes TaxID=8090 RepID=A0A3P9IPL0_ORYLA
TMTSDITAAVVKLLSDHHGSLDLQRLEQQLRRRAGSFPASELRAALTDEAVVAVREGRRPAGCGQLVGPDSLLVLKTPLRLCQAKSGACARERCERLHLCKYFVSGNCSHSCKNSHSLASPHNAVLLQRFGLEELSQKQLFQLLLQNDPFLLPEVCSHYNMGDGPFGNCTFTTSCTKLHVCRHHLQGDCRFGGSCKRAHVLDQRGLKLLQGLSPENTQNLHRIYRNKFIILNQQSAGVSGSLSCKCRRILVFIFSAYFSEPKLNDLNSEAPPFSPCGYRPFHDITVPTSPSCLSPSHFRPGLTAGLPRAALPSNDWLFLNKLVFNVKLFSLTLRAFVLLNRASSAASAPRKISISESTHKPPQTPPEPPTTPPKVATDAEGNEICLFFLCRHCSFKGTRCARVHWHLPYRWQHCAGDGLTWKDIENMEEVEKAYCDPHVGAVSAVSPASEEHVDFLTMTFRGAPVRRLSTASCVSKPPHFILTTQWLWYWKDERGAWAEYGKQLFCAGITSQTLEKMYLADRETAVPFTAGKFQYVLHFEEEKRMHQQNLKTQTQRDVRRRPRFVSAHDVETMRSSILASLIPSSAFSGSSSTSCPSLAENLPSHWDKGALPDFGFKVFKNLPVVSLTLNSVKKWFFQWQKEQMQGRNGGKPVDQRYLFHGTDRTLIQAICEQNFDWRVCGVHGTAYGKGSYFARDASFSNRYAKAGGGLTKVMFVALVLVGEYTRGQGSYVRPPPKRGSRDLYDSCVDRERDPTIFVVFEKQQIYPEYIIKYRDKKCHKNKNSLALKHPKIEDSFLFVCSWFK